MKKKEIKTNGVFFDARFYSPEAVKLAAVVFSGRLGVSLKKTAQGTMAVFGDGEESMAALRGEFINEALNQQCRMDLGRKNSRLARIVLTKALLAACGDKIKSGGKK
ncbi:MAG: hypothetical protein NTX59_07845 [Elusimicrobia bacterium]|nr:hypothetical protein [Elusimicrobiota bacterium]